MQVYTPQKIERPERTVNVPSAWKGLEMVLGDILGHFGVRREKALEFGVEYGFSTVALSNFFKSVVGVDTFLGDEHTDAKAVPNMYEDVRDGLAQFPNIRIVRMSYQEYIKTQYLNAPFDLIHVDIVHTYEDTFACGDWAMKNAGTVLFHDTESFPDVRRAVQDLAAKYGVEFYNYPKCYGLGILSRAYKVDQNG